MGDGLEIVRERGLVLTTSDGVDLAADAWHPVTGGRWPVLLQRLPYGRTVASAPVLPHPIELARRGYAVVVQDVRGRGDSTGTFHPFVDEANDGAATIEWAAELPFANGDVATYGFSYQGVNQLLAATRRPPALRAIAAMQCSADPYEGWSYQGGCRQWQFVTTWAAQLCGQEPGVAPPPVDLTALPISDALGSTPPPWYREWLEHDTSDDYWTALRPDLSAIDVPVFSVGGWFDTFSAGTLALIEALDAEAVIGPWAHMPWGTHVGGMELGADAGPRVAHQALLAFFDRVLKGIGDEPAERVKYYTGGVGWRAADSWPPAGDLQSWCAVSGGSANSRHGDGRLVRDAASTAGFDVIAAEPLVPVPGENGPLSDESAVEDRRDVLCYTSPPLDETVDVVGTPLVRVTSRSDVNTHDLVVTLTMVDPDERSWRLATGCTRVRAGSSAAMTSRILLRPIAWRVPAGHRLRLDVSASRFPMYDRNPQNGAVASAAAARDDLRVALIEIHAVRLELPTGP